MIHVEMFSFFFAARKEKFNIFNSKQKKCQTMGKKMRIQSAYYKTNASTQSDQLNNRLFLTPIFSDQQKYATEYLKAK